MFYRGVYDKRNKKSDYSKTMVVDPWFDHGNLGYQKYHMAKNLYGLNAVPL